MPSPFSIYNFIRKTIPASQIIQENSVSIHARVIQNTPSIGHDTGTTINMLFIVWVMGIFLMAMFFIIGYVLCRRAFQSSLPVQNEYVDKWIETHRIKRNIVIRQANCISAPLTYGIVHPVILLPQNTNWEDIQTLNYCLLHEHVHIKRCDVLNKLLLILALCVHWFNPFVWIMYVLANRDIELSCDETVINSLGSIKKSAYAFTLIQVMEIQSGFTPLCNSFSKNAIEERITAIMKMKKMTVFNFALGLIVIATTATVFVTSAMTTESLPNKEVVTNTAITMTRTNKDGKNEYSLDEGETWISQSQWEQQSPQVEWWTYEEYKEWLEKEKIELQKVVGSGAKYMENGEWVEWTQKTVDKAIEQLENTLEQIEAGIKVSKTIDGKEDIILSVNTSDENYLNVGHTASFVRENGETIEFDTFASQKELWNAIKKYCKEQVELGEMSQSEADEIIQSFQ